MAVTTMEGVQQATRHRGVVVRHERFGPLIWSHERHAYYRPLEEATGAALLRTAELLAAGHALEECAPAETLDELRDLGFGLGVEHIVYDQPERLGAPLEFYFDYTWLCNLAKKKCGLDSFCYSAEVLGPTTMKPDRVWEIIAELREWGVMRLHLAGGEPTINKNHLENYLRAAYEHGIWTSVNTNGTLVDDRVMDIVLAYGLKSMSFSIDGSTEDAFAQVRGEGVWHQAMRGLRLAIRRKEEAGSDMQIAVKPTFAPDVDRQFFVNFVELAIREGADVIKFANPERCLRHEPGYYETVVDEHYENIELIAEIEREYGDRISITNIANPMAGCGDIGLPGLTGCIGGQELLALNPDGSITPCLIHPRKLGELGDGDHALRDFWNGSGTLRGFWGELAKPQACNGCDIYSTCRSGSTTRRVVQASIPVRDAVTGAFSHVKDPLCPKDYLSRHPEKALPPQKRRDLEFPHFTEVVVKHAL